MTIAFKHVARELAKAYAIVAAALLALFDLIAFLAEAEDIGQARYNVVDALTVVIYSTPALLVDLAPFIALLATLNAFANLDGRSEITALRAAGVSRRWVVASGGAIAIVLKTLIAGVVVIARPLHLEGRLLRMYETAKTGNPLKRSGFWMRAGDTIVNISALDEPTHPGGIRIYDFDGNGLLTRFESAASADVRGNRRWQLNDVVRKTYADAKPVSIERIAHEDWTPVWALPTDVYSLPVASLSIRDLTRRVGAGEGHETEQRELWRRVMLPLSATAYAVLAVAFALGAPLRGGKAVRMAVGIAIALLIYISEQLVVNAGTRIGLPLAFIAPLPPLAVLGLAAALLRRAP